MKPERPVTGKHMLTGHILRFNLSDSHQHGLDPRLVKACCNGRRSKYAGYKWTWCVSQTE